VKKVILVNRLDSLVDALEALPGPLEFLNFETTQESFRMVNVLRERAGAQEIPLEGLLQKGRELFKQQYVESIGRINQNNHSLDWWSMPFTDKNPFDQDLCRLTSYFLLIIRRLQGNARLLVVITNSNDLAVQVKLWAASEALEAINAVQVPKTPKWFLKAFTPAGIIKMFARTLFFWVLSRRYKPVRNEVDDYLLITSPTHLRSFSKPQSYTDVYFGPLVEHFEATGRKAMILALVLEQPLHQLQKLKSVDSAVPVMPIESCLTIGDIIRSAFSALKMYVRQPKLKGTAEIDGVDFSFLVNRAIWDAYHTGNSFMSFRFYYSARWLAQRVRLERCIYVYENLPWERMLVLGIRSVSPKTRILGYQHASVTASHINLMLAEAESVVAPFPDAILTTGEVVKDWLQREGNYPTGVVKSACALRQGQPSQVRAKQRALDSSHILVALATSQVEYIKTLLFLTKAFEDSSQYSIRIRPHPSIPIKPAIEAASVALNECFTISDGLLSEDLEWADTVLYASSTVGMEGVAMGIPAICIDLGEHLDTDPMFGWNEFKWSVAQPSDLIPTIERVRRIADSEFSALQLKGQEYLANYLSPVTEDGLRVFWEG